MSLEHLNVGKEGERGHDSFVISESKRPILLRRTPGAVEPDFGTLRLVVLEYDNNRPVDVAIQAMQGGVKRLSFTVPREYIVHAGTVFDLLTADPYTTKKDGQNRANPLTEEKISAIFKKVIGASQSPDKYSARDGVRQSLLSLIGRGVRHFNLSSTGEIERGAPSLESELMRLIEGAARGNVPEQEKEPLTLAKRIADAGTKIADMALKGPRAETTPPKPGSS